MRQINTTIPNTTHTDKLREAILDGPNPHLRSKLRAQTSIKHCYTTQDLDDIYLYFSDFPWAYDVDKYDRPFVTNLKELSSHKYYDEYYRPYMSLMMKEGLSWTHVKVTQSKDAEHSMAVSLPLKAARVNHDVPYQAFNHPDIRFTCIRNFFPHSFAKQLKDFYISNIKWKDVIRPIKFNDSTTQEVFTLIGTGFNIKSVPSEWRTDEGYPMYEKYQELWPSKYLMHMALQSWIFGPTIRSHNMILDLDNWDNVPEVYSYHLSKKTENKLYEDLGDIL